MTKRGTLTNRDSRPRSSALPRPHLVRVLGYERPRHPGARHDLDGCIEVAIGRGDADGVTRAAGKLELAIADPRMSSRHARLVRGDGGWVLKDLDSQR